MIHLLPKKCNAALSQDLIVKDDSLCRFSCHPIAHMQGQEVFFTRVAVAGRGGFLPFEQALFPLRLGQRTGADFDQSGTIDTDEYLTLIYKYLSTSKEIDGVALLALDALYDPETGELDRRRTDLWVSNRFLAKKVKELNDQPMREGFSGKKLYWVKCRLSMN